MSRQVISDPMMPKLPKRLSTAFLVVLAVCLAIVIGFTTCGCSHQMVRATTPICQADIDAFQAQADKIALAISQQTGCPASLKVKHFECTLTTSASLCMTLKATSIETIGGISQRARDEMEICGYLIEKDGHILFNATEMTLIDMIPVEGC